MGEIVFIQFSIYLQQLFVRDQSQITLVSMTLLHGNSFVGPATHFVSYVRDDSFVHLVSALDVYINVSNSNPGRVFFRQCFFFGVLVGIMPKFRHFIGSWGYAFC